MSLWINVFMKNIIKIQDFGHNIIFMIETWMVSIYLGFINPTHWSGRKANFLVMNTFVPPVT